MIGSFLDIKSYLDKCIDLWRKHLEEAKSGREVVGYRGKEAELVCRCYIDAFQSVRTSIFDKLKK